ncbi:MAG: hypothetical protein ACM3XR_08325 [Bacillota bacterium]
MIAKTGKWEPILRVLATSAVNASAYAAIVVLRTVIFGTDGGVAAIILYISSIVLANLSNAIFLNRKPAFASAVSKARIARIAAFMLNIKDIGRFVASAAAWASALLPLAAGIILFAGHGIFRILFELLSLAAAYAVSLKHTRLGSAVIMGKTAVFAGFFVLFASLEAPNIFDRQEYLRPWLYGAAYFYMLAYLIVRNQDDIDVNIYDKKHVEKSLLPKNMRRFNMLAVCVVFIAILLISNLKTVIATLFGFLGKVIVLAIQGILWILKYIMPNPEVINEGGVPGKDSLDIGIQGVSPVWNFILNVLRNFTIIYILYRILLAVAIRIPSIARIISGWLAKLFSLNEDAKPHEESEYADESETVKPEWIRGRIYTRRKNQRKTRKKLKYITDPVEKVRRIYATVLGMLQMSGIKTETGDTTLDIVHKAAFLENVREELSALTDVYNQVRYGGVIPDKAMMAEALNCYINTARALGFPARDA